MGGPGPGTSASAGGPSSDAWYFTREQLAASPSRRCGLDADKELSYRQQAANLIQDMGQRLLVSQLCINTAIVYMHRFYAFHSFTHFHRNSMAAAALFLAAKVEEQPRKLEYVIKVAHVCLHRGENAASGSLDPRSEHYQEQAQDLVFNENVLLQTLGFDVAIDHPHTHVVRTCHLVKASKDLAQTSYFMASNSLHLTTMCLQYKPTVVACFCIHLASKWSNWAIPQSNEGRHWFSYVDGTVTTDLLEKLTAEFLHIFDRCPSRLKRKMKSISSNSGSPQSGMPQPGTSQQSSGSPFDPKKQQMADDMEKSFDRDYENARDKRRAVQPGGYVAAAQPPPSTAPAAHKMNLHEYRDKREREQRERRHVQQQPRPQQQLPAQPQQQPQPQLQQAQQPRPPAPSAPSAPHHPHQHHHHKPHKPHGPPPHHKPPHHKSEPHKPHHRPPAPAKEPAPAPIMQPAVDPKVEPPPQRTRPPSLFSPENATAPSAAAAAPRRPAPPPQRRPQPPPANPTPPPLVQTTPTKARPADRTTQVVRDMQPPGAVSPLSSPPSKQRPRTSSSSEPELVPVVKKLEETPGYENLIRAAAARRAPQKPPTPPRTVNGIETNPTLVSNLLKESLARPVTITPPVERPVSRPPSTARVQTPAPVEIKQAPVVPVVTETIVNAPVLAQTESQSEHRHKSEKKKKKEKHKHKDRDKPRDERKKHKKDKDKKRDEPPPIETPSSDSLRITIPRDMLATSPGLKIKIPKERLAVPPPTPPQRTISAPVVGQVPPPINSHVPAPNPIPQMQPHQWQPQQHSSGIKIKIPKEVLETSRKRALDSALQSGGPPHKQQYRHNGVPHKVDAAQAPHANGHASK